MSNKPALKVLLCFIAGIFGARYFEISFLPILITLSIIIIASLTLITLRLREGTGLDILLILGLICGGFLRYQIRTAYFPADHISNYVGLEQPVAIEGVVVSNPEIRGDRVTFIIETKEIVINKKVFPTNGKIQINLKRIAGTFEYGDRLILSGKLLKPRNERNPGEFDYQKYLMAQGIFGIIYINRSENTALISKNEGNWFLRELIFPLKNFIVRVINRTLPGKEGRLLKGLLVGERGEISYQMREDFARAGIIHILAVSGLHVGFVIVIFMAVFDFLRIPYTGKIWLTLAGLTLYVAVIGFKPPVIRASIMASLFLLGQLLQRKADIYNILAIAALVILLTNPLELFQPGFQLSFAAVIAIVYLYPRLKKFFERGNFFTKLNSSYLGMYATTLLWVSLAAQLGTLPFTVYYFNKIPVISIGLNLLAIPLVGFIVALGFVTSIFAALWWPLAEIYAHSNWLLLTALIKLVEWTSRIPFSYVNIPKPTITHVLVYFIGLGLIANLDKEKAKKWFLIFVLVVLNLFVWAGNLSQNHRLTVTFFDVGQGDAALITLPDNRNILIDGGEQKAHFNVGQRIIAPYLIRQGVRKLDAVILTHPHNDHIGGLPYILKNFQVGQVIDSGQEIDSEIYMEYRHLIDSLQIPYCTVRAGDRIGGFDKVGLFVLHPTDAFVGKDKENEVNNSSVVIKLVYGKRSFLLMGDAGKEAEEAILHYGDLLKSDVLRVGHHGSTTSSTLKFVKQVNPKYAVISVGEFNPFNQPSDIILRRLKLLGIETIRTDKNGAVVFRTDGEKLERRR